MRNGRFETAGALSRPLRRWFSLSAGRYSAGDDEIALVAGTANDKLISTDLDRTNFSGIAANLAGPSSLGRGKGVGFLELTQFANGTPGHHGVGIGRDFTSLTSHDTLCRLPALCYINRWQNSSPMNVQARVMPFGGTQQIVSECARFGLGPCCGIPNGFRRAILGHGFVPFITSQREDIYSVLRACVGDTEAARLAGMTAATNPQTIIAPAADASATGSQLDTP
jgi:hypothetical protein